MKEVLTLCHRQLPTHKRLSSYTLWHFACDRKNNIFRKKAEVKRASRIFQSFIIICSLCLLSILSRSFPVIFCLYVSVFKFRFQASILSPRAIPRYQGGGLMDWKFLETTPQNLGIIVNRIVVAQCRLVPLGVLYTHQVNHRQLQCLLANN